MYCGCGYWRIKLPISTTCVVLSLKVRCTDKLPASVALVMYKRSISKFGFNVCTADSLFSDKEINPFFYDIFVVLADKLFGYFLIFCWQWGFSRLVSDTHLRKFAVEHNYFKNTIATTVAYMNMDWRVFVGIEIENKTEILIYLWHVCLFFICKYSAEKYKTQTLSLFFSLRPIILLIISILSKYA